jgi:hypothetical protein
MKGFGYDYEDFIHWIKISYNYNNNDVKTNTEQQDIYNAYTDNVIQNKDIIIYSA